MAAQAPVGHVVHSVKSCAAIAQGDGGGIYYRCKSARQRHIPLKIRTIGLPERASVRMANLTYVFSAAADPAYARDLRLRNPETVTAAWIFGVTDSDTLTIDCGFQGWLTGAQASKLRLKCPGFLTWPLTERAKRTLEPTAGGQTTRLAYWGCRNRHLGPRLISCSVVSGRGQPDRHISDRRSRADVGRHHTRTGYLDLGDDWRADFTIFIRRSKMELFRTSDASIG